MDLPFTESARPIGSLRGLAHRTYARFPSTTLGLGESPPLRSQQRASLRRLPEVRSDLSRPHSVVVRIALASLLVKQYRRQLHRRSLSQRGCLQRAVAKENDFPAPQSSDEAAEYIHSVVDAVNALVDASSQDGDDTWQEVARPPQASCLVRVTRPRTHLRMRLDTAAQVTDGFELLRFKDKSVSGALPLFLEIGGWPSWYPFCREATLLHEWGPDQLANPSRRVDPSNQIWGKSEGISRAALWHLVFRIGPLLHVDTVGMAVECPGTLEDKGELWHYVFSPEPQKKTGIAVARCLGVDLPALDKSRALLSLRVPLAWSRTAFRPIASDRGLVSFSAEVVNLVPPGPFKWAIRLFWSTIATRAVGVMRKHIGKPLALLEPARAAFYSSLDKAMEKHLSGVEER